MLKFISIFVVAFLFISCTTPNNINFIDFDFRQNIEKEITFDSCTNYSFIANKYDEKNGKLFIEYISLDSSCSWNGFQRGYFEYLFKSTLKLKSFELKERIEFENYEVSTYLIDDKYFMNIIYKFSVFEDLFIIDYNGIYSTQLIKKSKKEYENIYLNKERFSSNYSKSLVKTNLFNYYFSKEKEIDFEK
uniref:hypothetical protein n=1 Tax=Aliarcobacter sp. TaxID=2321116 RepID=UPI0040484A1F